MDAVAQALPRNKADRDDRDRRAERPPTCDRSIDWLSRRRLHPLGNVIDCMIPIARFPGWVSGLLHGRHNEWLIVGFARRQHVFRAIANEGTPVEVAGFVPDREISDTAWRSRSKVVLMLHNHPHDHASRAQRVVLNSPSEADMEVARSLGRMLTARGIAHIALVCVDGLAYEYYWCAPSPGPQQLEFGDIFDFEPDRAATTSGRGRDGRFVERISPWAKAAVWPRAS